MNRPRGPLNVYAAYNRTRQCELAARVRVAQTFWTRFRGLMGCAPTNFRPGQGLWIRPCHGIHTLAMRFPLDAIYLDRDNVVVHTAQSMRPWRIGRTLWRAQSVLELPAGTIGASGTQVGDRVEIGAGMG